MNLLIRNGLVVNADKSAWADVLVCDGRIEQLAPGIDPEPYHAEVIDASGKLVIPGGVDPHVHFQLPTPAGPSSDDFRSGSTAALMGGVTTFIDFVTPQRGQSLPRALELRLAEAEASLTDFSFHVSPVEVHDALEAEMLQCMQQGIRSFKVYMAYLETIGLEQDALKKVLDILGRYGCMATVHAETGDVIAGLRDEYFNNGQAAPFFHALSRPPQTESDAVKKVLELAARAGCPVYLVHISAAASLLHIKAARDAGQPVFAETCPQYLLLNDMAYDQEFEQAARFVISPPLRKKHDNDALWQALTSRLIQSTGTDHCPFSMQQKRLGRDDFRRIPNGAGGVEHRMALLYTYGVLENRLSLGRWVDLVSTGPARIFGLYPRKGCITPGADADLVVWDPEKETVISAKTHYQQTDINIFEGIKTKGGPEYVISKGRIAVQNGKLMAANLKGNFLRQHKLAR
jgi:dihydropyrimidinase